MEGSTVSKRRKLNKGAAKSGSDAEEAEAEQSISTVQMSHEFSIIILLSNLALTSKFP
jgi:hypothetical protein